MAVRKRQSLLEVAVKVSHEMQDSLSTALRSFAPSLMWRNRRKQGRMCLLTATVVMDAQVDRILSEIEETLRRVEAQHPLSEPLPVEVRVLEPQEHTDGWRKQLRPGKVSPRLTIGPPCQRVHAGQGERVLVIDSQEAFGSGNHPSTRLALRLLDELLSGQYGQLTTVHGWVLDAGCGSGVLALAAAALGGFKVLAVDLDPRAIDATRANLGLNPGLGSQLFLAIGELSCARGPFSLVLANLIPTIHERVSNTLWRAVAPGGWLILSGFCRTHKDSIVRPYLQNGATEKAYSLDHTWAGTLLCKPES